MSSKGREGRKVMQLGSSCSYASPTAHVARARLLPHARQNDVTMLGGNRQGRFPTLGARTKSG